MGPGLNHARPAEAMGLEGTLLGVDVPAGRQTDRRDVTEPAIVGAAPGRDQARILVTRLGGQGHYPRPNRQSARYRHGSCFVR